jgi:1-acyl-sn-glycerol-3-phosphate acyltransferase
MPSLLDTLTRINLDDLVSSFGWEKSPFLASMLRCTFINPARKFANQMADFDNLVGQMGLTEASRSVMKKRYIQDVRIHGSENVPQYGSTLFLSNHPGMSDTLSLFASINRTDLKIIATHRPFLELLVNTTRQLFFIDDDPSKRMNAVRQVANHLRNGGSALTFPAGEIEPDPLVYPGAVESLGKWTDSAGVFIRFAPETKIIPVLVFGVIWERAARHWLTHFKRTRFEREKFAAALQLLALITRDMRPNTVHVQIGKPITMDEVGSTDSQAIHKVVIERMQGLILNEPTDAGVSAL